MTLWPIDISFLATKVGRSTQTSMPIKHGEMLVKKGKYVCSFELRVEQPLTLFVNPVDLENLFYQIDANSFNVYDGRFAQVVTIYRLTMVQEIRGDHLINKAFTIK